MAGVDTWLRGYARAGWVLYLVPVSKLWELGLIAVIWTHMPHLATAAGSKLQYKPTPSADWLTVQVGAPTCLSSRSCRAAQPMRPAMGVMLRYRCGNSMMRGIEGVRDCWDTAR